MLNRHTNALNKVNTQLKDGGSWYDTEVPTLTITLIQPLIELQSRKQQPINRLYPHNFWWKFKEQFQFDKTKLKITTIIKPTFNLASALVLNSHKGGYGTHHINSFPSLEHWRIKLQAFNILIKTIYISTVQQNQTKQNGGNKP